MATLDITTSLGSLHSSNTGITGTVAATTDASVEDAAFPSLSNKSTLQRARSSGRPRWSLAHDLAHLFRASSSTSSSSATHSRGTTSTSSNQDNSVDGCRIDYIEDYEKHAHEPITPIDLLPKTLALDSPSMTSQPPAASRKAKIYEFISRSVSRSRSKSTRRSSKSSIPPDSDLTTTTITTAATDPDATVDSHSHLNPNRRHHDGSKPTTRSPSRPLSSNTSRTTSTITPLNAPTRARTPRVFHPHTTSGPPRHSNDMDDQPEYDISMPPPPVPSSKRRSKPPTLFGIPLSRSRPTTPKGDRVDLVSPPLTPVRGRSGWDPRRGSRDRASMEKSRASGSSTHQPILAPKPRSAPVAQSFAVPHRSPIIPAEDIPRRRSSPPTRNGAASAPLTRPPSSLSSRSGERCSPLFGIRLFNRSRSRGGSTSRSASRNGKERMSEKASAPVASSHGHSRDGGPPIIGYPHNGHTARSAKHGSFDFERGHSGTQPGLAGVGSGGGPHGFRPGVTEIKRSVSSSGAERRNHAHSHAYGQYSQSTSARAHLRARQDAAAQNPTASAHSHSTMTTNTDRRPPANNGPPADGSWGRQTRTTAWARTGIHPPFAFESAASSTGRASPAETKSSLESRKSSQRGKGSSQPRADGAGQYHEREVDLGLGLAWAPSKIRVREFTGARERAGSIERERGRKEMEREQARLALEGRMRERREMGYADTRKKEDKEVTARYRAILGEKGFEAFKKYVRRFDAEVIPLDGPTGLLVRVRRLLDNAPPPGVSEREKRELIDDLNRIVLANAC